MDLVGFPDPGPGPAPGSNHVFCQTIGPVPFAPDPLFNMFVIIYFRWQI